MLVRQGKDVFVWHIEFGLLEIHSAIGMIVLVKGQQPVFAVSRDMSDQVREPFNHLPITLSLVRDATGTEIDFEFQPVKRMSPRVHLSVHEGLAVAGSDSRDMCVINQPGRIDVCKSPLNQVSGSSTELVFQL